MKNNDAQKGRPNITYSDTSTNILAIGSPVEGMIAFATDTNNFMGYDGTQWIILAGLIGGDLTINDGDIITDTTTGMKIGTGGTQKVAFYGVTPVVRASAYTQTYSTSSKTVPAITSLNAPAGGTGTAAGGWSTAANRNLAITSINATQADLLALYKVVTALIDDLQAMGIVQ